MPDEQDLRKEPSFGQPAEADATAPEQQPAQAPDGELEEARRKAQENHEARLRALAEMENIRKRAQIDVANAHKYALEGFAADLLPVRDSLEAALAAENSTLEALRSGVELTLKQLATVFDKTNLKE